MHSNKRRRIEESEVHETEARYLQAIIPEIDVEIGLRENLAETIEGRIAWAMLLQEALRNEPSSSIEPSSTSFRDVALDALEAIESRNRILFQADANVPVKPPAPSATRGRPPPKEKPITRSQNKAKFLYVRSNDQVYILRCPTCLRHSFSMLQGLYNHNRISHRVEWGSHEECIKACAVSQQDINPPLDLEAGVDVGTTSQLGGILPGMRTIFQMAVDGSHAGPNSAVDGDEDDSGLHLTRTLGWHGDSPALAQFLGKEATRKKIRVWNENEDVDVDNLDQPSMKRRPWRTPYLQRSSAKDFPVVETTEELPPTVPTSLPVINALPSQAGSSRFHMTVRVTITDHSLFIPSESRASEDADTHKWMISVESPSYSLDLTAVLTSLTVSPLSDLTGLAAPDMFDKLSTTDPPFLVVGTTSEHFLAKVELKFTPSLTRPEGQTVIFEHWVGLDMIGSGSVCKGEEQVVDVELDRDTIILPVKTGYLPVSSKRHWDSGDEVELGESAETKGFQKEEDATAYQEILKSLLPKFPMTMQDVAKSSNARTNTSTRMPYKLVADMDQLRSLVMGRRKAIEWGRAKAIRDAYSAKLEELKDTPSAQHLIPLTIGDVFCWLGDEGHFFREKVEIETTKSKNTKGKGREFVEDDKWCRVCGLGLSIHKAASTFSGGRAATPSTTTGPLDDTASDITHIDVHHCTIVPKIILAMRLPIVDVQKVVQQRMQQRAMIPSMIPSIGEASSLLPPLSLTTLAILGRLSEGRKARRDRILVSTTDTTLVNFVMDHVNSLRLAHFSVPTISTSPSPLPHLPMYRFSTTGLDVDAKIAPYAYLALVLKQFVAHLIKSSLDVLKRDKEYGILFLSQLKGLGTEQPSPISPVIYMGPGTSTLTSSRKKSGSATTGRKKENTRVQNSVKALTPLHVLGAISAAQTATGGMFASLARLGVPAGVVAKAPEVPPQSTSAASPS